MARKGATIPNPVDTATKISRSICLPTNPAWYGIITGLLIPLTQDYFWDSSTGDVDEAVRVSNEILASYSFQECGGMQQIQFRQAAGCELEVSYDAGSTWSGIYEPAPCIPAPLDFTGWYSELNAGDTPYLSVDVSTPGLVKYTMNLPPIPEVVPILEFSGAYQELASGATPQLTATNLGDVVTYTMKLPPPVSFADLHFSSGVQTLSEGDAPELDVQRTGDFVSYIMKLPPIPGRSAICPDAQLPSQGLSRDYYQMVDSDGTFLPMLVDNHYKIELLSGTGFWAQVSALYSGISNFLGDPTHFANGQRISKMLLHFHPVSGGVISVDPTTEYQFAESGYAELVMNVESGGTHNGQICAWYRLTNTALTPFCTVLDFSVDLYNWSGNISGIIWSSYVSEAGWFSECVPANYNGTSAVYVERDFALTTITKITITYDESPQGTDTFKYHNFLEDEGGEFETWDLIETTFGTKVWEGERAMSVLRVGLFASRDGCAAGSAVLRSIRVEGNGENPFGGVECP